ncbi:hypothetical protein G6F59_017094 [Rhizopus arrhizus]|nr:hypothetical protein G6F59_017094 [Rhizopus arrhizus]
MLKTASYRATSTIWPCPAWQASPVLPFQRPPVASRWRSAIRAPITPCSAAIESPMEMPTRSGGRSGWPDT